MSRRGQVPTKRSRSVASHWDCQPADLPAREVERLRALMLVEEHETTLRLTAVGKQRYLGLPNSTAFGSGAPDEALARIAEFNNKARD